MPAQLVQQLDVQREELLMLVGIAPLHDIRRDHTRPNPLEQPECFACVSQGFLASTQLDNARARLLSTPSRVGRPEGFAVVMARPAASRGSRVLAQLEIAPAELVVVGTNDGSSTRPSRCGTSAISASPAGWRMTS